MKVINKDRNGKPIDLSKIVLRLDDFPELIPSIEAIIYQRKEVKDGA